MAILKNTFTALHICMNMYVPRYFPCKFMKLETLVTNQESWCVVEPRAAMRLDYSTAICPGLTTYC